MAKGQRDWAQLDAFETEYRERLTAEKRRGANLSQYLHFLNGLAEGRSDFWSDEVKAEDEATGRLFALRGKIFKLREKLGIPEERLLADEKPFLNTGRTRPARTTSPSPKEEDHVATIRRIRFLTDPATEGYLYPVTYDDIKAVLGELPVEHIATVHEIRLSNQKRTGSDGDWLEGEIRLHCLIREDGRRLMGKTESEVDVRRFGGSFEGEGNRLYAVWPLDAFKIFVLRRVLIHEIAHGVAELPGYAERVRRAGSVEKFCEQYAENFYRPAGKSVRLGF